MMFFVQHLSAYAPKNRAWKKLTDYITKFENVLIKDERSRSVFVEGIRKKVEEINTDHPKLKPIRFSARLLGGALRIDSSVDKGGSPDMVFLMDVVKVNSIFQVSENVEKGESK